MLYDKILESGKSIQLAFVQHTTWLLSCDPYGIMPWMPSLKLLPRAWWAYRLCPHAIGPLSYTLLIHVCCSALNFYPYTCIFKLTIICVFLLWPTWVLDIAMCSTLTARTCTHHTFYGIGICSGCEKRPRCCDTDRCCGSHVHGILSRIESLCAALGVNRRNPGPENYVQNRRATVNESLRCWKYMRAEYRSHGYENLCCNIHGLE